MTDPYRAMAERHLGRPITDEEWTPERRRAAKELFFTRMYGARVVVIDDASTFGRLFAEALQASRAKEITRPSDPEPPKIEDCAERPRRRRDRDDAPRGPRRGQ